MVEYHDEPMAEGEDERRSQQAGFDRGAVGLLLYLLKADAGELSEEEVQMQLRVLSYSTAAGGAGTWSDSPAPEPVRFEPEVPPDAVEQR